MKFTGTRYAITKTDEENFLNVKQVPVPCVFDMGRIPRGAIHALRVERDTGRVSGDSGTANVKLQYQSLVSFI